jgi:hypothetical protein
VEAENLDTLDLTRVFTPDVILPIQGDHPPASTWLQRLCLAILDDALKCLGVGGAHGGPRARARYRHEARAWVLSEADYCFSFASVCSVLNLDAGAVRRQLRQHLAGDAPQGDVSRQLRQPLSRASVGKRRVKNPGGSGGSSAMGSRKQ